MPAETELESLIVRMGGDADHLLTTYDTVMAKTDMMVAHVTSQLDQIDSRLRAMGTTATPDMFGKGVSPAVTPLKMSNDELAKMFDIDLSPAGTKIADAGKKTGTAFADGAGKSMNDQLPGQMEQAVFKGHARMRGIHMGVHAVVSLIGAKNAEQQMHALGHLAMGVGHQFGIAGMLGAGAFQIWMTLVEQVAERWRRLTKDIEEGSAKAFGTMAKSGKSGLEAIGDVATQSLQQRMEANLKNFNRPVGDIDTQEGRLREFKRTFQRDLQDVQRLVVAETERTMRMPETRLAQGNIMEISGRGRTQTAFEGSQRGLQVQEAGFAEGTEAARVYGEALQIAALRNESLDAVLTRLSERMRQATEIDINKTFLKVGESSKDAADKLDRFNLGVAEGSQRGVVYAAAQRLARQENISLADALTRYTGALNMAQQADEKAARLSFGEKAKQMNIDLARTAIGFNRGTDAAERFSMVMEMVNKHGMDRRVAEQMVERLRPMQEMRAVQDEIAKKGIDIARGAAASAIGGDVGERYKMAQAVAARTGKDVNDVLREQAGLFGLVAQAQRIAGMVTFEKQTRDIEDESDRIGMAEVEAKLFGKAQEYARQHSIGLAEALTEVGPMLERQRQAMLALSTDVLDKQVTASENHARLIGKSESEAKKLSMVLAEVLKTGQTEEQVRARIANQLERAGKVTMIERGAKTFEDTRTPMEKYGRELNDLDDLLNAGEISQDTYARAAQKAANSTINSTHAHQGWKAALAGSAEGMAQLSQWQDHLAQMAPSADNAVAQMARAQDKAGLRGLEMNPNLGSLSTGTSIADAASRAQAREPGRAADDERMSKAAEEIGRQIAKAIIDAFKAMAPVAGAGPPIVLSPANIGGS